MGQLLPSFEEYLPSEIVEFVRSRVVAEFATCTLTGVPIDTPTFVFPSDDLTTLGIGTGLAYPAKAERARRNPKVGLLFEGAADEPVVSVAGYAAVKDADVQANLQRYLAETILTPNINPAIVPWEKTRKKLFYLSRVLVEIAPVHVRWWRNRAGMEVAADEWRAPLAAAYPPSDPSPSRPMAARNDWGQRPWPLLADQALASGLPAHLTLVDDSGFPLPIRVRDVRRCSQGFLMTIPAGAPWRRGKATITFVGKETFVGDCRSEGLHALLSVERALPILPMMEERGELSADVLAALNGKLAQELERRGQPMPVVPEVPPRPTAGALLRAAAAGLLDAGNVGSAVAR